MADSKGSGDTPKSQIRVTEGYRPVAVSPATSKPRPPQNPGSAATQTGKK